MQRYQYINNLYISLLGGFLSGGFCPKPHNYYSNWKDNKVGILYIIGQNNWPMKLKHWYISYLSNSFIFQTSKPQNLLIQQTQSSTSHSDTLTKKYTMYIFILSILIVVWRTNCGSSHPCLANTDKLSISTSNYDITESVV